MSTGKSELYKNIETKLEAFLSDNWLTNLSNTSALLFERLKNVNWSGFYLAKGRELFLGPFQGKAACLRIAFGKGVCGTAAERLEPLIVPDVHLFPGHIACDSNSKSEIVIPVVAKGRLIGVLDVDSPILDRFDEEDLKGLTSITHLLNRQTLWPDRFF